MIATYVGMFLGLIAGTLLAGPTGGVLGILAGLALGTLWAGCRDAARPLPTDAALKREQHELLCIPKGLSATATFVRDAGNGRWLDVERCSLCSPEDQVGCRKRCLVLMRDVVGRHRAAGAT